MSTPALPWGIAVAVALGIGGCDLGDIDPAGEGTISADHPCAERALAPSAASLWRTHRDSGAPVPFALAVPLAPGVSATVTQGPDQAPTHHGINRWAWDLAIPYGTAVHAAAGGVVAWVRDDSRRHGYGHDFADDANYIVVDHGGGLFSNYTHLAHGSAVVTAGDVVAAGDMLAATGASGQLSGPHLHFQLENVWSQSLPARFINAAVSSCDAIPGLGDTVTGDAAQAAVMTHRDTPSAVPPQTYAGSGVLRVSGLPARVFERSRRYRVSGRAAPGHDEVYLLVAPPRGGDAVGYWRFVVDHDGDFAGDVQLDVIPPGPYGVALVAVPLGTVAATSATVRASLVD